MSLPGPKPKPTPIRLLEGNPGHIKINEHEPKPEVLDNLDYPEWLSDECEYMKLDKFPINQIARMIWDEMSKQLLVLNVLTKVDKNKFARYCECFARWLKAKSFLDKHGDTYPVYGGQYEPRYNPDGSPDLTEQGKVRHEFKKYLKQVKVFPQVAIYAKLTEQLRKYEEEFGIGAASRTRIQTIVKLGHDPEEDEFNYAKRKPSLAQVK